MSVVSVACNSKGSPDRKRRRGSVLVLVMTLLGVLFVTGVAFLASMNFETATIAARQQRDVNEHGVRGVADEFGSILRDGLMAGSNRPFSGTVVGRAKADFAELPGVHNLFAPIEPHQPLEDTDGDGVDDSRSGGFVFPWITDVFSLATGSHDGWILRALRDYRVKPSGEVNWVPFTDIDTNWPSGVQLDARSLPGITPRDWAIPDDKFYPRERRPDDGELMPKLVPVDADGDGIVDTFQFKLPNLGFSEAQVAAVSPQLNPLSNPTGEVHLGLRIIAHGGLVNLNESHPNLIAHVLDLDYVSDLFLLGNDPAVGYFRHRPTSLHVPYSPELEEPLLRRRGLLPPRFIPPSWLHGNPFLEPDEVLQLGLGGAADCGGADMWWMLFPPRGPGSELPYETVYQGDHTYTPFPPPGEPDSMDPELMYPVWAVRMEPFLTYRSGNHVKYDRRHLVTTISHDDLLSRGGRWEEYDDDGNPVNHDLLEEMRQANRMEDALGLQILPFEYADYPQDIINNPPPESNPGGDTCVSGMEEVCRFDPRKGRLQLSLPWLDKTSACEGVRDADRRQTCLAQRTRLIYDVFMMLVRNARGLFWDEVPFAPRCAGGDKDGELCATASDCLGSPCRYACPSGQSAAGICFGGDYAGGKCTVDDDCPDGGCAIRLCLGGENHRGPCAKDDDCPGGKCHPGLCVDDTTQQSAREALTSRTAASLTANMIDYMDLDGRCIRGMDDGAPCLIDGDCDSGNCSADQNLPTRVPLRGFDFSDPESAGRPFALVCYGGSREGYPCTAHEHCCGPGEGPPDCSCRRARVCVSGFSTGGLCRTDSDCPGGWDCIWDERLTCKDAGALNGRLCTVDGDCGDGVCTPPAPHYVYGIERQPFITEVASAVDSNGRRVARAVELFNPYDVDLAADADGDGVKDYVLVQVPPGTGGLSGAKTIEIEKPLAAGVFSVFLTPGEKDEFDLEDTPAAYDLPTGTDFAFEPDWIVYLVRNVKYPGDADHTQIVLDQIWLDEDLVKYVGHPEPRDLPADPPLTFSIQRPAPATSPWKAVVPMAPVEVIGEHKLGLANGDDLRVRPVHVGLANTGTFTRPHPFDADTNTGNDLYLGRAFPTTGSLLLLMRYANRSLDDHIDDANRPLAFTAWLGLENHPVTGDPLPKPEFEQIGNGRMPVFDHPTWACMKGNNIVQSCDPDFDCPGGRCDADETGEGVCVGGPYHNIVRVCSVNSECLAFQATCQEFAAHHALPDNTPANLPGGLDNLPWGQLVFDYFTALPLGSPGPYNVGPGFVAAPESTPRVDLTGLRVHGRININAAPWKVLGGLPLVDSDRFPKAFRDQLGQYARSNSVCSGGGRDGEDCEAHADCGRGACAAARIHDELAQAIVAYREQRSVIPATGDYADDINGRGWTVNAPAFRRGMGFLTVGELANVRHLGLARTSDYRIDRGVIMDPPVSPPPVGEDYVAAIALLASLGDWVTVRSQVFTVYGVLRGEDDLEIEHEDPLVQARLRAADVDSRAIRFQETVDRLPTFLGQPAPVLVGERVVRKYTEVHDD